MTFMEMIRFVCEELNFHQKDLARALNVRYTILKHWENEKARINKIALSIFTNFRKKNGIVLIKFEGGL